VERPTETQCPVCDAVFQQPVRAQGGGKRTIYCSPKCRSLDWVRGNGGKRSAAILKYNSKPENKERRKEMARIARLAEYGLTPGDFDAMLERQRYKCLGCLSPIDRVSARVDHCHDSGAVRGLLCDHCNWAIGHAKDDPMVLRRLQAYLEADRHQTCVYVIGSLRGAAVPAVGHDLRQAGFTVWDDWHSAGETADDSWRDYEIARGRTYPEALQGVAASNTFRCDRAYIDLADAVVLAAPAGKSAHLELGYALGQGKPGYVLLEEENSRYDVMYRFATGVFMDIESLVKELL
jgi:hypothetical protein